MGVDLTVCPIQYSSCDWWLAYNRLRFDRDYELQVKIKAIKSCPIPSHIRFDWYGDSGLERNPTNPYGEPVEYVTAGELATAFWKIDRAELSEWNCAMLDFIQRLKPETNIVLWWH